MQGTQLGGRYPFKGLQRHLGIDYDPGRDDTELAPEVLQEAFINGLMALQQTDETIGFNILQSWQSMGAPESFEGEQYRITREVQAVEAGTAGEEVIELPITLDWPNHW